MPAARAAAACVTALAAVAAPAGADGSEWSAPATLSACAAGTPARVVFPSDSPTHATGPGVLVWADAPGCSGGARTREAAIGPGDIPGRAATLAVRGAIAAAAPHGRVIVAGTSSSGRGPALVEGVAGGPLVPLGVGAGSEAPLALTTAYLGDVAFGASVAGGGGLHARIERYFARTFGPWMTVEGGGAVTDPALALDYRTDLLAAWKEQGSIYARDLPASGSAQPRQRLAAAPGSVRIAALRSDDNRGIVVWSEQRGGETRVYLDQSSAGVRFGRPQLLERFRNPRGTPAPAASPQLVRLRSESVMIAWAGASEGHWAVRAAPIDQLGLQRVGTISRPGSDALLAALAPGPDGGALALWTEPQPGADGVPDAHRAAITAARGIDTYPGLAAFGAPEQVAPPGPNGAPSVAIDPRSDRALAVWREAGGALRFSVRTPSG
jgi:hypothetical protein